MTSGELELRLEDACTQLAAGSEALLAMTSAPDHWRDPICKAASLLEGLDLSEMARIRCKEIAEGLHKLESASATAGRLLDSAATLHFGRVLSRASFACGYLADGEALSTGGSCFRIDG
jgi:hypothetical protein